jgi:hypothetical protein
MPAVMTSAADRNIATNIAESLDKIESALALIEPALARHGALRSDVRQALGELDALIGHMERSDA